MCWEARAFDIVIKSAQTFYLFFVKKHIFGARLIMSVENKCVLATQIYK